MEKHRKIYMDYFDLGRYDFAPCELLGGKGRDVHHIWGRQKNEHMEARGIEDPNDIRNLMFLGRHAHSWFGQKEKYNQWLYEFHLEFMKTRESLLETGRYDEFLVEYLTLNPGQYSRKEESNVVKIKNWAPNFPQRL